MAPELDSFRIIYPGGDRSVLAVADIFDYEADEYSLASQRVFYDLKEANEYARDLAKRHGLRFQSGSKHDYLD